MYVTIGVLAACGLVECQSTCAGTSLADVTRQYASSSSCVALITLSGSPIVWDISRWPPNPPAAVASRASSAAGLQIFDSTWRRPGRHPADVRHRRHVRLLRRTQFAQAEWRAATLRFQPGRCGTEAVDCSPHVGAERCQNAVSQPPPELCSQADRVSHEAPR
jgi:hypothetical protein